MFRIWGDERRAHGDNFWHFPTSGRRDWFSKTLRQLVKESWIYGS